MAVWVALPLALREHPSGENNIHNLETSRCHHAVMVSQEHLWQHFLQAEHHSCRPTNSIK